MKRVEIKMLNRKVGVNMYTRKENIKFADEMAQKAKELNARYTNKDGVVKCLEKAHRFYDFAIVRGYDEADVKALEESKNDKKNTRKCTVVTNEQVAEKLATVKEMYKTLGLVPPKGVSEINENHPIEK